MKIKNKLFAIIAMVLCLGMLSGCAESKNEAEAETMDAGIQEYLNATAEGILQNLDELDNQELEQSVKEAEEMEEAGWANAFRTWITTRDEVGKLGSIVSAETVKDGKHYITTLQADYQHRPMKNVFTFNMSTSGIALVSAEFSPEYSVMDNLARAGQHTVIGMGTVFLVLIFISFLISCFKFINAWEKKRQAKSEPSAPAPVMPESASVPAPAETASLTDDLELVAVITAAIAAATDQPAEGLVVRSIRRKPGSKWKRA